jgi:predicted dehydrogenase
VFRNLLREGQLGEPLHGLFNFDHFLIAAGIQDLPDWWLSRETGGGWLRNYNTHGIDLIRYMIGDFAAVCGATHADASRGMSADDSYVAAFALRGGMQGVMAGSCRARDFFAVSRVTGTLATASFDRKTVSFTDAAGTRQAAVEPAVLEHLQAGGPPAGSPAETLPKPASGYEAVHSSDHGFAEQVYLSRGFLNRIMDRGYTHPAIADFSDGLAHMEVVEAVEVSARTRRWVDLPS